MSIKYHDTVIAGTPEVATVVEAGNTKPVTSGGVYTAIPHLGDEVVSFTSGVGNLSNTYTVANGKRVISAYIYNANIPVAISCNESTGDGTIRLTMVGASYTGNYYVHVFYCLT